MKLVNSFTRMGCIHGRVRYQLQNNVEVVSYTGLVCFVESEPNERIIGL